MLATDRVRLPHVPIPTRQGSSAAIPITHTATRQQVGLLVVTAAAHDAAYLAWYADPAHAGHGYISEAVRLLLPTLLEHRHRIIAVITPGNDRSRHLAQAVGFQYEGTARQARRDRHTWADVEVWSLLAADT
ncbi:GNAT family N-acetyltransferase [Agromyces larvae]|uniref:GNAT family N-acetyltransferase n=1 Tax=Agromyces larvae TaxID=2929802 RepID=A0ABY4C1Y5_9MICO|nr:GNAT family protein [Agromyces larvae]UOE45488.1 GNAT family N-acetyltransferase [Agromyces larvae]